MDMTDIKVTAQQNFQKVLFDESKRGRVKCKKLEAFGSKRRFALHRRKETLIEVHRRGRTNQKLHL